MNKYIVVNGKKESKGQWEYEIGEIITFNSTQKIKCVRKEIVDGELLQHFVGQRLVWDDNSVTELERCY